MKNKNLILYTISCILIFTLSLSAKDKVDLPFFIKIFSESKGIDFNTPLNQMQIEEYSKNLIKQGDLPDTFHTRNIESLEELLVQMEKAKIMSKLNLFFVAQLFSKVKGVRFNTPLNQDRINIFANQLIKQGDLPDTFQTRNIDSLEYLLEYMEKAKATHKFTLFFFAQLFADAKGIRFNTPLNQMRINEYSKELIRQGLLPDNFQTRNVESLESLLEHMEKSKIMNKFTLFFFAQLFADAKGIRFNTPLNQTLIKNYASRLIKQGYLPDTYLTRNLDSFDYLLDYMEKASSCKVLFVGK